MHRHRSKTPRLMLVLAATISLAAAHVAIAADLSSRPHQISVFLAPTFGLSDYAKTQFDLAQSYGYHFLKGADGPWAGLEAQEGMGSYFRFSLGARAGWDLAPITGKPFYVSPDLRMGFTMIEGDGYFNLRFGTEAKVLLDGGLSLHFRPIGVNLSMGSVTSTSWDLFFGVGYAFDL